MDSRNLFKTVVSSWPVLLLVGFASIYLPKVSVAGYRWSIELALGLFIVISCCALSFSQPSIRVLFSPRESFWILLPIGAFVTWSGLSFLWAESWRAATHHTLLWAQYLLFYVLLRISLRDGRSEETALNVLGIVIFIIAGAGAIEFLGSSKPITLDFTTRFYSYAEAIVCILPLFVARTLTDKSKRWFAWPSLIAVSWFLVVTTMSRAMFVTGLFGIVAILILKFWLSIEDRNFRRTLVIASVLVIVTLLAQLSMLYGPSSSLSQRLYGSDEDSRLSARSRLPLWGMALEGYRLHPVHGIGGDNFYSDYKLLRASYSMRDPNNDLLEINEDLIPERVHNEYLQILCELGSVGGLLFGWLIVGLGIIFISTLRKRVSLMRLAAFCGMLAFLLASSVSSYSFRFATNGLCFFFVLAVALRQLSKDKEEVNSIHVPRLPIVVVAIVISLSMIAFSTYRALTVRHFANSQNTSDRDTAKAEIEKAIAMDPSDPVFHYYNAERLYLAGNSAEAVPEFRQAIDNGIATSPAYFDLLAATMKSGQKDDASQTFEEAMRVYPRSVFLRTAYASFLKRVGQKDRAETEFQTALAINEKQARSWQLAHDEGLERLVQVARTNDQYVSTFDLKPSGAPLALANFQSKDVENPR